MVSVSVGGQGCAMRAPRAVGSHKSAADAVAAGGWERLDILAKCVKNRMVSKTQGKKCGENWYFRPSHIWGSEG